MQIYPVRKPRKSPLWQRTNGSYAEFREQLR